VSGFDGNFDYLLRELDGARRVVEGWPAYGVFTAEELVNLDNVRRACKRLAQSIEEFITTHDELDPDNQ
jgi:hypothetical protein